MSAIKRDRGVKDFGAIIEGPRRRARPHRFALLLGAGLLPSHSVLLCLTAAPRSCARPRSRRSSSASRPPSVFCCRGARSCIGSRLSSRWACCFAATSAGLALRSRIARWAAVVVSAAMVLFNIVLLYLMVLEFSTACIRRTASKRWSRRSRGCWCSCRSSSGSSSPCSPRACSAPPRVRRSARRDGTRSSCWECSSRECSAPGGTDAPTTTANPAAAAISMRAGSSPTSFRNAARRWGLRGISARRVTASARPKPAPRSATPRGSGTTPWRPCRYSHAPARRVRASTVIASHTIRTSVSRPRRRRSCISSRVRTANARAAKGWASRCAPPATFPGHRRRSTWPAARANYHRVKRSATSNSTAATPCPRCARSRWRASTTAWAATRSRS